MPLAHPQGSTGEPTPRVNFGLAAMEPVPVGRLAYVLP
jgi:hypothetical protein